VEPVRRRRDGLAAGREAGAQKRASHGPKIAIRARNCESAKRWSALCCHHAGLDQVKPGDDESMTAQ
jgi:hypothetical protein